MSCQVRVVGSILNVEDIKKFLFLNDEYRGSDIWLQQSLISISPTADIIALAKGRKLVVLSSKWDSSTASSHYEVNYSGLIHEVDDIRAVLCLPIISESRRSHIAPDWSCILLGFESGFVRAYTETCELIYEEQFHNESVASLKCQSQHNPRADLCMELHTEEIYVQYKSNLCAISGNKLFTYLRHCRAQLARVQANSEPLELNKPNLNIRKWGFQDQSVINDIAVVGLAISTVFDNFLTASTFGGYDSQFRSIPPQNTLVLGAGSKPYLAFHYAIEGGNGPVLSDVAKAVAHKLKSALPTWLVGSQQEKRPSPSLLPADQMGCRFGLCDLSRTATAVILSPTHKFAAVSDSLGRVVLVDTEKGFAVRVLKGLRDAQCSFVQVPDERHSKHRVGNKVALFLVVYSPRKGTIEIFTTQSCAKICTFTASKYSRLLYISYGLMGFQQPTKSKYACQFTTIFLDNDGKMKEFLIPFHYALSEKNNKRARDIHLYKKLKELIKNGNYEKEVILTEAFNTTTELQTVELKSQLIQLFLKSKSLPTEVLLKCCQYLVDDLSSESGDEAENELKVKVLNILTILKFYLFTTDSNDDSIKTENVKESKIVVLKLEGKEMENLNKLLDLNKINDDPDELRVTFSDKEILPISEFLSVFNLHNESSIALLPNKDETIVFKTAEALFDSHIKKRKNYGELLEEIFKSKIPTKDLFYLLITYWVNRPLTTCANLEFEMDNLTNVLHVLVESSKDFFVEDTEAVEDFWREIRDMLMKSNRPFPALTAAISCKYVAFKIESEGDSCCDSFNDLEIWSQENIEWSLLIGKLEDVSLLNILLSNKPAVAKYCHQPKLSHDKIDISLKYVLEKKGSVSELVARWLTTAGLDPELIVINENLGKEPIPPEEEKVGTVTVEIPKEKLDFVENETIFKHFNMIRVQWPYSLEASMILSNMAWEYAIEWKKDIQNLLLIQACIACLKEIPNFHLKLGLFNLIWKTHLNLLFENVTKLLNKMGKVPKERVCLQETGLTDVLIPKFIDISTEFLDIFTDIVQEMYNVPKSPLNFEPLWENGGQPLAELAIQQTNINYELLVIHYELSLVFQMLCTFSIRAVKPINNLFDCEVVNYLYHDFQEKPDIDYQRKDSKLTAARLQCLTKIIQVSVEHITVKDGEVYARDHMKWMNKCLDLAIAWDLERDKLRLCQVVQLFIHGYDVMAFDLNSSVYDRKKFGEELLMIAGRRMKKRVADSKNIGTYLSALTPVATNWMDKLSKDWCADGTLKQILDIARLSLSCLEDDQRHLIRVGMFILEACETLISLGEV